MPEGASINGTFQMSTTLRDNDLARRSREREVKKGAEAPF